MRHGRWQVNRTARALGASVAFASALVAMTECAATPASAAAPESERASGGRRESASRAAAEPWLPPFSGDLTGTLRLGAVPGAPELKTSVRAAVTGGRRTLSWTAEGAGTQVRGAAVLDAGGEGTWQLEEGTFDAAVWSEAVAGWLGADFRGTGWAGQVTVRGEGTWRQGVLGGQATLRWHGGTLDHAAQRFRLDGVALEVDVTDLARPVTGGEPVLTWTGGSYAGVSFGAGRVAFAVTGRRVRVARATLEIFGGELVLAAFDFSTQRPEASVIARVVGLDVSRLLPFLPPILASARGRVDGSVALHRAEDGIRIGNGTLALRSGETADLRLAPTPGLLSANLPEAVLKLYPGLGRIETGEVPLRAERLEVAFTPGGDAEGRTAAIRLLGGPEDPRLKAPVDLNVNVRGPLERLIKFGTDSRLRIGGGEK